MKYAPLLAGICLAGSMLFSTACTDDVTVKPASSAAQASATTTGTGKKAAFNLAVVEISPEVQQINQKIKDFQTEKYVKTDTINDGLKALQEIVERIQMLDKEHYPELSMSVLREKCRIYKVNLEVLQSDPELADAVDWDFYNTQAKILLYNIDELNQAEDASETE